MTILRPKSFKIGFGVVVLFIVNFLIFNIALKKEVNLVEIAVVNETIYPRTKIEESMITYMEVPASFITEKMYTKKEEVLNLYSDIQTTIPSMSPFYKEVLFAEKDLPDFPKILLNDNQVVYTVDTDLVKLSGNSIVVGQIIDLYTTYAERKEVPIVDLLVSSVRVIGIKDKKGIDVNNPESNGVPNIVLLALDKQLLPIVRSCDEIASLELFAHSTKQDGDESILNEDAKILAIINDDV